jgi:hypothetical protein
MESFGHMLDYSILLTDTLIPPVNTDNDKTDDTRSWVNVKEFFSFVSIAFTPEWINAYDRHSLEYQYLSFHTFFWWFVILIFLLSIKFLLLLFSPKWNQLTRTQRINVIIYVLELIFSTYTIIWFLVWCAPVISFTFGGFQSYLGDQMQYNETLGWIEVSRRFSNTVGYAVIPMCCLYMVELVLLRYFSFRF